MAPESRPAAAQETQDEAAVTAPQFPVDEASIRAAISALLPHEDLGSTSLGSLRRKIEVHVGLSAGALAACKDEVAFMVQDELLAFLQVCAEDEGVAAGEEAEEEEDEARRERRREKKEKKHKRRHVSKSHLKRVSHRSKGGAKDSVLRLLPGFDKSLLAVPLASLPRTLKARGQYPREVDSSSSDSEDLPVSAPAAVPASEGVPKAEGPMGIQTEDVTSCKLPLEVGKVESVGVAAGHGQDEQTSPLRCRTIPSPMRRGAFDIADAGRQKEAAAEQATPRGGGDPMDVDGAGA